MIVGIAGQNAAGKDTLGDFFVKKGFKRISISDEIRDILKEEGIEVTRQNMLDKSTNLRKNVGIDYLIKRIINKIGEGNWVIVSIRYPGDLQELRKLKDFVLVNIETPAEKRFENAKARGDDLTWEEFLEQDEKEFSTGEYYDNNLKEIMESADVTIINDGSLAELKKRFEEVYDNLV